MNMYLGKMSDFPESGVLFGRLTEIYPCKLSDFTKNSVSLGRRHQ